MAYKRKHTRLPIECLGDIHRAGEVIPCKAADLCEQGMRIQVAIPMKTGEELTLVFGLGKTRRINCSIQVVRLMKAEFGAQIVKISPEDQAYLTEFLDDFIASNFGRF